MVQLTDLQVSSRSHTAKPFLFCPSACVVFVLEKAMYQRDVAGICIRYGTGSCFCGGLLCGFWHRLKEVRLCGV